MNTNELQAALGIEIKVVETTADEQAFLNETETKVDTVKAEKAAKLRTWANKLPAGATKDKMNAQAYQLELEAGVITFTKNEEPTYKATNCSYMIQDPSRKVPTTTQQSISNFKAYEVAIGCD